MDLLEKASIILTPTAYNNGEALCVKPSDGSGDFDFSRNSAATRVNAQGLVENVQILSSNLVQNGDFSELGAEEVSNGSFSQEGSELIGNGNFTNNIDGWVSYNSTSTWDDGTIKTTVTGSDAWIRQNQVFTINKYYKVTFKAKASNISQNIRIYDGVAFVDTGLSFDEVDVYQEFTYYLYTIATNIIIGQQSVSVGDTINFDNVSVKEVGQDWTFGTGWSVGDGVATKSGSDLSYLTQSSLTSVIGKTYRVRASITNVTTGNIRIDNFTSGTTYTSDTEVDVFYTATTAGVFRILGWAGFDGSVTNISVKEVGQNWTIEDTWTIGNGVANGNGATGAAEELSQNLSAGGIVAGDKVKLSFEIKNYVSGSVQVIGITPAPSNSGNGIYEYIGEVTSVNFRMRGSSFNGSVTNISVIEITDDTNLPRINYEGFSYQDALGSELVVNGDFATDSDWSLGTGWSIGDNKLIHTGSGSYAEQGSLTAGTEYKVVIDVAEASGSGFPQIYMGGLTTAMTAPDIYTFYITAQSGDTIRVRGVNDCKINSISVKEYSGQEIVPDSGCGSWLFEPQSTNTLTYSEDFSQWSELGSPVLTTGQLAPDGTLGATKISGTIGTSLIYLNDQTSAFAARSIYARTVSGTGTAKLMSNNANTNNLFTLTEDWQRFEVNSSNAGGSNNFYVDFRDNSQTLSEFIIWGAQSEELTYSTSYIPTEGTTVTRNQDVCTNGGSLASINSTEGVLYFEGAALSDSGSNRSISISDGTNTNQIVLRFLNTANQINAYITDGGSITASLNNTLSNSLNYNKIALKYKLNDVALWVNGVEVATDTNATMPSGFDVLKFSRGDGANNFFAKTKALAVWKEALSDEELTELTTI